MRKNFKTKCLKVILSIIGLSPLGIADAGGYYDHFNDSDIHYVTSIAVGPAWTRSGQTETFYLAEDIEKSFVATKRATLLVNAEGFLGLQKKLNSRFSSQLGVVAAGSSDAKIYGDIWEDADPDFNNFRYTYRVAHKHVGLRGKLLFNLGNTIQSYISGTTSVGFNRSHANIIVSKLFEEILFPVFSPHTKVAFSYSAEVGVQKAIDSHTQVGLGYQFSDWGPSNLRPAVGQTLNGGLYLNHLYTHGAQFSVTYVA